MRIFGKSAVTAGAVLAFLCLIPVAAAAQEQEDRGFWTAPSKLFYLHAAGGLTFGENLSSTAIQDLIAPYEISGGGSFWGGLRAGLLNIVQVEFRRESLGRHNWTIAGIDTALTIQMAIQPKNVLLWKVNPIFFLQDSLITTFLYYGQVSNVAYVDSKGLNGYNGGDMKIYGFELLGLRKGFEAGIHIEYRDIVFHGLLASGDVLAFTTKASQYLLSVFIGFGWGY